MPKCLQCGEYHLGRSNSKYCSDKCRYESRYTERSCVECGNEVTGTKKKIFCCAECRTKFHNRKKTANTVVKTVKCKCCNTEITTKRNKIYCNETCRNTYVEKQLKIQRKEVSMKYAESITFEDFGHMDTDNIDILMVDLSTMKYDKVGLQEHMRAYGIKPRAKIVKHKGKMVTRNIRMNIVNINELLELYNIKIEKFKSYPTIGMKDTVLKVAKTIKIARKLTKDKQ